MGIPSWILILVPVVLVGGGIVLLIALGISWIVGQVLQRVDPSAPDRHLAKIMDKERRDRESGKYRPRGATDC